MFDLEAIQSCLDVTDEHISQALAAARSLSESSPRERCLALLARMVSVAEPGAGAPRMLMLLAQMAKRDWVEGDLIVRMIGDQELSVLELLIDDGVSRERIVAPQRIDVPLDEFVTAVRTNAALLLPLRALEATPRRLVLKGTRELRSQRRKASISAFSVDLTRQVSKSVPPPAPVAVAPPQPKRPPVPPPRPPRKKSLASFEKASPILEMPEEIEAPDSKTPKR